MVSIERILSAVLRKIKPSEDERNRLQTVLKLVFDSVRRYSRSSNLELKVGVEGSVAKDTWLSGDRDMDVFVKFPMTLSKSDLDRIITEIAESIVGNRYVKRYAEHPYVELNLEGFTIDLVPCYLVESPADGLSSVDRTPFHTGYVTSKLEGKMKDDVRLLKRFMKGIGAYGAEIKVHGFSGYLCELLVLFYGSFLGVLRGSLGWRPFSTVLDLENYYSDSDVAAEFFGSPLVVVDPVDKYRNVASALSLDKMELFIAASYFFLKSPSVDYFFPKRDAMLSADELFGFMQKRGSDLLFIVGDCPHVNPEVLWGQLYKSLEGIRQLFLSFDFEVISYSVWSDEENFLVFIFELATVRLPSVRRHIGPPPHELENSERFLSKYLSSDNVLSGPRVEDGRWTVYLKRDNPYAVDVVRDLLFEARLGRYVASSFRSGFQVFVNEEIGDFYVAHSDFASFLTVFLRGSYPWLSFGDGAGGI